jgi:predicted solute-binding protein
MVRATTFSFYPIFAIFFVLLMTGTGRDFGPMLIAEEAARRLCKKRRRLASSAHLTSSSSSTHLIGEDEDIATTRYAS